LCGTEDDYYKEYTQLTSLWKVEYYVQNVNYVFA